MSPRIVWQTPVLGPSVRAVELDVQSSSMPGRSLVRLTLRGTFADDDPTQPGRTWDRDAIVASAREAAHVAYGTEIEMRTLKWEWTSVSLLDDWRLDESATGTLHGTQHRCDVEVRVVGPYVTPVRA